MQELGSWCALRSNNLHCAPPLYDSPFLSPRMLASNMSILDRVLARLAATFPAEIMEEIQREIWEYLNHQGPVEG